MYTIWIKIDKKIPLYIANPTLPLPPLFHFAKISNPLYHHCLLTTYTTQKMRIWSHLLKKSLMENVIFCAVLLRPPKIFGTEVYLYFANFDRVVQKKWKLLRGVFKTCYTSKLDFLAKIMNGFHTLTTFPKSSILDAWHGFEYFSGNDNKYKKADIENQK